MTIAIEPTAAATIVPLQGQINSANAAAIEAQVLALVDGGTKNLILDFAGLDYISSAGLRMVLVVAKRLKQESGLLVLCGMQPHVREVFDISGFLAILNVEPTRSEALTRF
ncbi:STAS domain-containing protein [Comamonas resistens]|jgi:stage II sporulation protein AA (anti-sigma F factor antagonist)|uniref:Anti-sigma factor antagonist n=1 Tax=Comamonas resistens TaxID=3046670 RepID=A0ABY8SUS5_9BURK|nr:STAS domain-containing protein [Comamonas resistens]MDL5035969.1 STAS domain-containing protein [Comamonas resistens]WHS66069.1 STAS domain-containing protein [Comamonas resistens]